MEKVITIAVAGYGLRGQCYSQYTLEHPDTMKVVAVADIVREKVDAAKQLFNLPEQMCFDSAEQMLEQPKLADLMFMFNLPEQMCFDSAEQMLEQPKLADLMFICTQDRQHVPMALAALEKGYHVLLEKPISPELSECIELQKKAHEKNRVVTVCHVLRYSPFYQTVKQIMVLLEKPISPELSECIELQKKAHEKNRVVTVCHVLRYSPFYQTVKQIMDSGKLGEIRNISAHEDVGYFHQAHSFVRGNWRKAHSFVRGNWRNSEETSPMILAKSCHDMDLLQWLKGQRCEYISSYGSLIHFRADKAPEGATEYCLGGCKCKDECPYDAEKIYITNKKTGVRDNHGGWPCNALCVDPTEENVYEAIKTGPYGRCVYHCDNDVVDHEVVDMEFENGATAVFTMTAFTKNTRRTIRVMGTLGELEGDSVKGTIEVKPFNSDEVETIDVSKQLVGHVGHAGGDTRLVDNIILEGDSVKGTIEVKPFNSDEVETIDVSKQLVGHVGHAGGDTRLVDNIIDILRKDDLEHNLTSIDASVHSHVMALAAEESRVNHGKSISIREFESKF